MRLAPIVETAIEVVRPAAEAKSVRLTTALDSDVGQVSGDPDRLQQIIWNLLSNAVKLTPRGGRVQVVLERVNSHVELAVSFPEGAAGDTAREALPRAAAMSHDRLCTVSRTVELGTPVDTHTAPPAAYTTDVGPRP